MDHKIDRNPLRSVHLDADPRLYLFIFFTWKEACVASLMPITHSGDEYGVFPSYSRKHQETRCLLQAW